MPDQSVPVILETIARSMGTALNQNRLEIPEKFGKGYCSGYVFNENIRLLISDYELHDDILVSSPRDTPSGSLLFFKFQNIFPREQNSNKMPTVLIATSTINTEDVLAIHSNTETINIEVDSRYLSEIFAPQERSPILQNLLEQRSPLIFEQLVYPGLRKIVDEILSERVTKAFQLFFLRVKAEELICRLLMELDKREEVQLYPLKEQDIQTLYQIKDQILSQLSIPPVIADLALQYAMSETKLKRLFRQIFGYSIFNYYQLFRMQEAARMLKAQELSVAEIGYALGFSNLSHFSRVFKAYSGFNPKKYSRG
ncbi:AraC family transcriptional regulator [Pedobacter sp. MC2016-15]|uniref:helix-turn-helix transcriptional regulator n=1 Tax=Pedobacter sp. MC2016-15 TaxID=2994473 RepID=UPI0022475DBD|nr:AraC family transcriptional regulator [Pedobacter sp. MC2016-15]MCX2478317.1 AraC family transcriptional regulator [Pedobacter sp. MC2016-15]